MTDRKTAVAYLDSNAFIDALEGEPDVAEHVMRMLRAGQGRPGSLVTSELTLAEVLAPRRSGATPNARLYLDLIVWGGFIDLQPVSRDVLYETADLRRVAAMKLPDAVHVVTAVRRFCRFFVSRDKGIKVPPAMTRVEPGDHRLVEEFA